MSKNKRAILILGTLPPPLHGASVYFQNLIGSELLHRTYRVHFLDLNLKNRLDTYQRFTVLKALRALKSLAAYLAILSRNSIDLVYAQIAFPRFPFIKDSLFVIVARLFRKRIIGSVVGLGLRMNYDAGSRLMKHYYRWIGGMYTALISPGLRMSQSDFKGIIPPEIIEAIPFGIEHVPGGERKVEREEAVRRVIFMGNFIRSKGIFDALHAIKYVCRTYPDMEFIFAGEWLSEMDEREATKIINEDDIGRYLKFVGVIEGRKKRDLMSSSQVFVLPTYYEYEGLPLALLEAMSYGHCIVTTDHAAISDVVKDGRNGYVCEKKNPADLGQKILRAIEDRDATYIIRKNNIDHFRQYYTLQKYMEKLIDVFNKHLSPQP